MKNQLSSIAILLFFVLSGCSKQEFAVETKDEARFPVSFSISTFKKEVSPMANANRKIASLTGINTKNDSWSDVQAIHYTVYNEAGNRINSLILRKGDDVSKFGKLSDKLPNGKYTISFVASSEDYKLSTGSDLLIDDAISFDKYHGGTDVFFKQIELIVSGSAHSSDIFLERMVGNVTVELLDEVPKNVLRIAYNLTEVGTLYHMSKNKIVYDQLSRGNYYYEEEPLTWKQDISLYFFEVPGTSRTSTLTIQAFDNMRNLLYEKVIPDVPIAHNKRTILRGKLFDTNDGNSGQGFNISINDAWEEDDIIEF